MIKSTRILCAGLASFLALASALPTSAETEKPEFWKLALKPPMGWNSYDAFGDSVTEEEVLDNARYAKKNLLSHGWNYIVVDYRWYDPMYTKNRTNAILTMDQYGRLLPATNRFPSAIKGDGFKPLGKKIHSMGFKFGIHIMRGIPRAAVAANLPIEGSNYRSADAANTNSFCSWNPDMFGVNGATPAGQAWYDSIFRQYAAWKVDYVKADDLSSPYSDSEVEAIRKAIERCGRPMVLSLSPGGTPHEKGAHAATNANLWRISADFWDFWKCLNTHFDLITSWRAHVGPGHWPDADMIPFGRIGKRCDDAHGEHWTHFTKPEQVTLMTLWAMAPSPLMLGMNLPDNDDWTLSLLTNDEVLAVNQDRKGAAGLRVSQDKSVEVWVKELADGSKAVALFNRGEADASVKAQWSDLGLSGKQRVRNLWERKDIGKFENSFESVVEPHGAKVFRLWSVR